MIASGMNGVFSSIVRHDDIKAHGHFLHHPKSSSSSPWELGIDLPPTAAALRVISSEYISSRHAFAAAAVALVILWCFVTGKMEGGKDGWMKVVGLMGSRFPI